jgi:patatin-related protein
MQVVREVRFAIVMYGGVSLAIYMNGVAQELLRMVRATAPDREGKHALLPESALRDTEVVYRRLGQLLYSPGSQGLQDEILRAAAADRDVRSDGPDLSGYPINTRFIVDIISGTSAGGINGICLAKALANGESMDALADLWITEGDIETLLNDGRSRLPGVPFRRDPQSLLNSQRMYRLLYSALERMDTDPTASRPARTPLARDVDLFVTTTDIRGVPVPIRLADRLVSESRHRTHYHFLFRDDAAAATQNDFARTNNPILAFAARSTSSFPFAFEPAMVGDINGIIKAPDPGEWQRFFPEYARFANVHVDGASGGEPPGSFDFRTRAFGDGGYLDNKPFALAIDALRVRRATVPVDRKLLYIEPAPEHPERELQPSGMTDAMQQRPDVVTNLAAALTLSQQETIRGEVERVLQRNRLLERVDRILDGMENDVRGQFANKRHNWMAAKSGKPFEEIDNAAREKLFVESTASELTDYFGVGYGGYQRLRVAATTDDLADIVARVARFEADSDEFLAIREIIRDWRDRRFSPDGGGERETYNAFLFRFDLPWRLRRLDFVLTRIDRLHCLDDGARVTLERLDVTVPTDPSDPACQAIRALLDQLSQRLSKIYETLRRANSALREPSSAALRNVVLSVGLKATDLREVLSASGAERASVIAMKLAAPVGNQDAQSRTRLELVDELAGALQGLESEAMTPAGHGVDGVFTTAAIDIARVPGASGLEAVLRAVRGYYDLYDYYDCISFPILFATDVGEERSEVSVTRISPEDATSLIDESTSRRRKLAGTALMHFGAFLDRRWRENDILWGRLDGAERLISVALAPRDSGLVQALIDQAHRAVLIQQYAPSEQRGAWQRFTSGAAALLSGQPRKPSDDRAGRPDRPLSAAGWPPCAGAPPGTPEELRRFFARDAGGYEVDRTLDPRSAVESLSRAARVFGRILKTLGETYSVTQPAASWAIRVASVFYGVVEVSMPHSAIGLLTTYWANLIAVLAVVMIVGGWIGSVPSVERFGAAVLIIVVGVRLMMYGMGDLLRGRRGALRALGGLAAVVILGLAFWGARDLALRLSYLQ